MVAHKPHFSYKVRRYGMAEEDLAALNGHAEAEGPSSRPVRKQK